MQMLQLRDGVGLHLSFVLGHSCNGGDTHACVYDSDARTILYCDAFLNAHRLGRD